MKRERKQFLLRLRVVFGVIVSIGFVLIANLFYIQITNGNRFREQADGQYVVSTYNSFERGNIYFEEVDGTRINAAVQKSGYKISINPKTFSGNKEDVFSKINNIIDLDKKKFFEALNKKNRTYIEIANKISKEDGKAIKKAVGKYIQLHSEKWRTYPLKGSAAHVIGFLGYKGDEYAGRYGLERSYEDTLKREDVDVYTNFFARIFHNVKKLVDPEKVPEGNIVTTIEPQVQLFFEHELEKIQKKWRSASVGGIIMNPKTGEVYSLGAYPNFDNNDYSQNSISDFKNPLVENVYELGSIIKPFIVAMGIDSGEINVNSLEYYDKGSVAVEDYVISNFDKKGRGWVQVQDILNQSLNTGMVYISQKITKSNFREYFAKYGFTSKTGIDLPNESNNLSSNLKSNRQIEFANMSFGQGIAITPISLVSALSALANDGIRVTPHIVKKIEYTNGFSKTMDYSDQNVQVLSKESAGEISRMLVNVFDEYRDGDVKLPHHRVAAKTGTAQIPNPQGGYYDDRNLHSFFGYFPAYDPQFIVFMYTVHPKKVKYSSQTLIDPFRSIAKYLINYYNVPPDR